MSEVGALFCLLIYILATSKVILGRVLTCNSAHSWHLFSDASLRQQAAGTMTTQSYYPDSLSQPVLSLS